MKKLLAFALAVVPFSAMAMDMDKGALTMAAKEDTAQVATPEVIAAIKAQNKMHADLTEEQIIELDNKWRAEKKAGGGELIDEVLANGTSDHLKGVKILAGGRLLEIFVMDNKGLNVGQSDVTSDYWQGDEAKFKKSFGAGADAVFVDEVEMDESTNALQTQVSVTIKDPETGEAIGAVTYGVKL
ncbi:MAG: hypothetical protein OXR68_04980 [Alphaproteobacteria bacterium]|nr:hypothetical protein [Alphaproteobacteria bacterium]MDD9919956.1 hypothetical protein [Alphaproteobacteria bacterium]